jgi:hypothetical protein
MSTHINRRESEGTITIIEPWQMTAEMLLTLENFRLPPEEYPTPAEREKELSIDRSYNYRATYVIYTSKDGKTIIAAARIIAKNTQEEKLPIEWGRVASITDHSETTPFEMKVGEFFNIKGESGTLPVCEIGGFRAAEINLENHIDLRMRYRALDSVMKTCSGEVHKRGFHTFFLTCVGKLHMERLYRRYYFTEAAQIIYADSSQKWKALWRWPFKAHSLRNLRKDMPLTAYVIPHGIGKPARKRCPSVT